MKIRQEIIINKPVADCWKILGEQYTEVYQWASMVNHAEGDGKVGLNGASCDVRGCSVSGMGDIKEQLTDFDPQNYSLAYTVTEGLPSMMKVAKNSWRLTPISDLQTRLNMRATIEPQGFMANLMKPMIKMKFHKMTSYLVEDFKYYVETGQPHPRKVNAAKKFAT